VHIERTPKLSNANGVTVIAAEIEVSGFLEVLYCVD
jgi:hypothetical protein